MPSHQHINALALFPVTTHYEGQPHDSRADDQKRKKSKNCFDAHAIIPASYCATCTSFASFIG